MAKIKNNALRLEIYLNNWFAASHPPDWRRQIKAVRPLILPKKTLKSRNRLKPNLEDLNKTILDILQEKMAKQLRNQHCYNFKQIFSDSWFRFILAVKTVARLPHLALHHWTGLPLKIKCWSFAFTFSIFVLCAVTVASFSWSYYSNHQTKKTLAGLVSANQAVLGAQDKNLLNIAAAWWQKTISLIIK